MKLRVDRDVLAEAVTWTARSVPVRPPVPVLAGVRLEADESSLVLASFDYEVSARCQVPWPPSSPASAPTTPPWRASGCPPSCSTPSAGAAPGPATCCGERVAARRGARPLGPPRVGVTRPIAVAGSRFRPGWRRNVGAGPAAGGRW